MQLARDLLAKFPPAWLEETRPCYHAQGIY